MDPVHQDNRSAITLFLAGISNVAAVMNMFLLLAPKIEFLVLPEVRTVTTAKL